MKYVKLWYMLSFVLVFDQQSIATKAFKATKKSSSDMQELEQVIVPEAKALYQELQDQIQQLQEQFFATISDKIKKLDSYSAQKAEKLISFLNDEVTGFHYQVKALASQTISDYFSFLQQNDRNFSYTSDLSASQIAFVDGVDHITQESLVVVQKMILDLTSQNVEQQVSLEIKHGFFESERHAQMLYEQQLKANEEVVSKSWWDRVKSFGESYLSELAPIAKEAIGKEVAKQTQTFINEVGAEVASEVGKEISDIAKKHIAPAISDKLSGLSEKLEGLTPALKEKLAALTDKLKEKGLNFWESESSYNDIALAALRKVVRWKNKVEVTEEISVRSAQGLCSQEQEYLKNRAEIVQEVLKKEFGIEKPLRIAFCCSGGGNRAMVGTLGIFMAAAKHNILQATTYIVGLSGSTWTIAPWVYLHAKGLLNDANYQDSLMDLKKNFISTLDDASMLDPLNNKVFTVPMLKGSAQTDFANQVVERFSFDQPVSLVNAWGALVGNYALNIAKSSKMDLSWSDINSLVISGALPLPLCSAGFDARLDVSKSSKQDVGSEYEWFETGPFEAGSKVLGYIPVKYFGSPFNQGKIISELACPEYPMSFYLGVYGSAFSLSMNDLVEKGLKDPKIDVMGQEVTVPVAEWVKKMIEENTTAGTSSKRHEKMHAQFANFSKGVADSYLKDKDLVGLFDGGLAFNIPLPLVLDHKERAVDIVIIYDSNPGDTQALQSADKYFKRKNISVPTMGKVSKSDLLKGKYPMTVFNDPRDTSYDKEQPTLIYFPTNVDVTKPPFTTANFKYTKKDIDTLMSKVSDSFENHINDIKVIMKKVADSSTRKKAQKPAANQKKMIQDIDESMDITKEIPVSDTGMKKPGMLSKSLKFNAPNKLQSTTFSALNLAPNISTQQATSNQVATKSSAAGLAETKGSFAAVVKTKDSAPALGATKGSIAPLGETKARVGKKLDWNE
jgi:hypothetical protein